MSQADTSGTKREPASNWRFEFSDYAHTRRFLDRLAELSKSEDFYPNINFGRTYANISIDDEGRLALGQREAAFVEAMQTCAAQD